MNMSEQARRLLAGQEAPTRVAQLLACRRRLEEVRGRLARAEQRVSWWDRAVFFHTTPDEAKAKAVREECERAEQAYETALVAWRAAMVACSSFAPIEIVFGIESTVHSVMMDPAVGREAWAGKAAAAALEAVAARVAELWAPEVDIVDMAARVPNDTLRRQAAMQPPVPLAEHTQLGWAPMQDGELFQRVAWALERSAEFAAARQTLAREQQEDASFYAALEHARAQVTFADKLTPWQGDTEKQVERLEAQVVREEEETQRAIDGLRLAVVRAFAAHPVTWLYFSLLGAVAAIRAAQPNLELVGDRSGDANHVRSASARGVILACFVELRRACEHAFPGVPSQVWPRGRQGVASSPVTAGPYRLQAKVADAPEPLEAEAAELRFFAQLDAGQVRGELVKAVSVATVMGFVSAHRDRTEVEWLDRLAFWSDTDEEVVEESLQKRLEAHQQALAYYGGRALAQIRTIALEHHPLVGLGCALPQAVRATDSICTAGGRSSSPRSCPTINKVETLSWLGRLGSTLERYFGVAEGRARWVSDICRRLKKASSPIAAPTPEELTSYSQVIELLAAKLQPTDFVALVYQAWQASKQQRHANHEAKQAGERVSFWDKVNVLSDTEDEKLRDAWEARASERGAEHADADAEMNRLLEEAMRLHPALRLYETLAAVKRAVAAIYARSERRTVTHETRNAKGKVTSRRTETYYVCAIYGQSAAERAMNQWSESVLDVFGPLPTPSDALEAWIVREL